MHQGNCSFEFWTLYRSATRSRARYARAAQTQFRTIEHVYPSSGHASHARRQFSPYAVPYPQSQTVAVDQEAFLVWSLCACRSIGITRKSKSNGFAPGPSSGKLTDKARDNWTSTDATGFHRRFVYAAEQRNSKRTKRTQKNSKEQEELNELQETKEQSQKRNTAQRCSRAQGRDPKGTEWRLDLSMPFFRGSGFLFSGSSNGDPSVAARPRRPFCQSPHILFPRLRLACDSLSDDP